jgi:hypothetical protein
MLSHHGADIGSHLTDSKAYHPHAFPYRREDKQMDSRITQLISEVEKHIESRHYSVALEQLAAAEKIEPNNESIHMIRELVKSLQTEKPKPSAFKPFLFVTVDPKSPTGIRRDHPTPQSGLQKRIRGLTMSAEHFLVRGDVENAFELLMRAYLLDPVAPEVVACEKHVLPAWQKLRGQSVTGVRHEGKLKIAAQQQPNVQSSLFNRLKSGTFP